MTKPRLLIIEDEHDMRSLLTRVLEPAYFVEAVDSAERALDLILSGHTYDVVLCDMRLEGWSGGDLHKRLVRRGDPHASRFVIISGFDVAACYPSLEEELGRPILRKPAEPSLVRAAVAAVLVDEARRRPTVPPPSMVYLRR